MKKALLCMTLLLATTAANASGDYSRYGWRPTGFLLKQNMEQHQRQFQKQGQGQFQENGNNTIVFPRGRKPALPIGTVFIPSANPTAHCVLTYAGGGGFPFGSIGGAISVVDWDCRRMEAGKYIAYLKNTDPENKKWDRMIMDTSCAAESIAPSRDCKQHLIDTAEENAKLDLQLANINQAGTGQHAGINPHVGPERIFNLSSLNPF